MTAKLDLNTVIQWFDAVRQSSDRERTLESFWDTQLKSKKWLINEINNLELAHDPLTIVIHGGWYGVLASMLFQLLDRPIKQIINVDLDPSVEEISYRINRKEYKEGKFKTVIADMSEYTYDSIPDIVINTSCEHVTAEKYSSWFDRIPNSSLIVCQSNNNASLAEHVNCPKNIGQFILESKLEDVRFSGCYPCSGYTRFMVIGKKTIR